jgi:transcriptional regulator with XRE-family HTH domain
MNINLRIKQLRESKKLSRKDFSLKLGIDNSQYSKIESGKLMPTIQLLMEISSNFDTSIDWLLMGKGEMLRNFDTELDTNKSTQQLIPANEGYKDKYLELIEKYSVLQEKHIALKDEHEALQKKLAPDPESAASQKAVG